MDEHDDAPMSLVKIVSVLAAVVVLGVGALTVCAATFEWRGFWPAAGQPLATLGAGLAALSAAAIALHNGERQREAEARQWRLDADRSARTELRGRFATATAQLSDDKATVRVSGVYAMAALADDWHEQFDNKKELQVCIDVLCGYLRTPNTAADEIYRNAGADGSVRVAILTVLSEHRTAGAGWTDAHYDLSNADLRYVKGPPSCNLTAADLTDARLTGTRLVGANLSGTHLLRADMTDTRLAGANLRNAQLQDADLEQTELSGADLTDARFDYAKLVGADLGNADLFDAHLSKTRIETPLTDTLNLQYARLSETQREHFAADIAVSRERTLHLSEFSPGPEALPFADDDN